MAVSSFWYDGPPPPLPPSLQQLLDPPLLRLFNLIGLSTPISWRVLLNPTMTFKRKYVHTLVDQVEFIVSENYQNYSASTFLPLDLHFYLSPADRTTIECIHRAALYNAKGDDRHDIYFVEKYWDNNQNKNSQNAHTKTVQTQYKI